MRALDGDAADDDDDDFFDCLFAEDNDIFDITTDTETITD